MISGGYEMTLYTGMPLKRSLIFERYSPDRRIEKMDIIFGLLKGVVLGITVIILYDIIKKLF
jgi:hypothetical protein